ncbi:hypothetical protein SLITO_v1c10100 [Spiroplasma litorale]|uniref:Transmembrane protein n=1 Tax=Spiroplasma litorale TaxID=216942 RepID=A0A0K1W361_9MOLU|nr:hypothetical protein SLITO_v1c10100 [Spiroplasma litorale]
MNIKENIFTNNFIKKHLFFLFCVISIFLNIFVFKICDFNCILILIHYDLIILIVIFTRYLIRLYKSKSYFEKISFKRKLTLYFLIFSLFIMFFLLIFTLSIDYSSFYNETYNVWSKIKENEEESVLFINSIVIFIIEIYLFSFFINSLSLLFYLFSTVIKIIYNLSASLKTNFVSLFTLLNFLFISIVKKIIIEAFNSFKHFLNIFKLLVSFKLNNLYSFYRWSMIP